MSRVFFPVRVELIECGKLLKAVVFHPEFPKPDLIVEVVANNHAKIGVNTKTPIYQKNKIPEYWIIDTFSKKVVQYLLDDYYATQAHYQKKGSLM